MRDKIPGFSEKRGRYGRLHIIPRVASRIRTLRTRTSASTNSGSIDKHGDALALRHSVLRPVNADYDDFDLRPCKNRFWP